MANKKRKRPNGTSNQNNQNNGQDNPLNPWVVVIINHNCICNINRKVLL